MAIGNQKRYAVRVTYRDGSSALYGPVSSRQEARRLAERVGGPNSTSRILRWTSADEGVGGVIARRPAPVEPAPPVEEPEAPLTITDVTWSPGSSLNLTGTGFTAAQAANTLLTFVFDEFPPGDDLDWQPTNDFGLFIQSDTSAVIFYGSIQSFNGNGSNNRLDATLSEIYQGAELLWSGSVFTTDAAPAEILSVDYDFNTDSVTIVGSDFDMNDVAQIDWEGNSSIPPQQGAEVSGSLSQPGVDWTVSDPSTLVIPSNTVAGLGSGSFSSLTFYDGLLQTIVSWAGYEEFT